ncbi:methylated-DNA--protein-cysteine methyltransferase [Flexivirga endophytica]|uniref:Methylated-DNA--protein-cysteine methyltransferase n=1 Tax=Flexivirga endophytica TaxID=1849103 RepID=A0A916WT56_9MICO|nr:methylated-DNA--[protein]-cysteine S-methyltransferase [Flexivirga endophytica]GGB27306.1 methylated-DNA--protein-cysteine methyltransferase [Flexivirga endophytica]GHB55786.1 methylated-DNA--protein-cysteine methyltransferase [Flexivirga endophytica]
MSDKRHMIVDPTPIGPITVIAEGGDIIAVYMEIHLHAPDPETYGERVDSDPLLDEAARQLTEYFAGDRTEFDLPLHPKGTEFQQRVWRALCDIPFGRTWSYGELAQHIGSPTASRAVGLANGRNPISIVIPCHRVIGANGSMTGYGGGIERKRWLLAHESGTPDGVLF